MKNTGDNPYVFISHSHKDIDKVRIIRNELEDAGFEPVCFFMACLSDKDEIMDLIRREIDARAMFVYVESVNSRASKWVQSELRYLSKTGRKIDRTINIDNEEFIITETKRLIRSMSVFISYIFKDSDIAEKITDSLRKKRIKAFGPIDYLPSGDFVHIIEENLDNSVKCGLILLLVSSDYLESITTPNSFARKELNRSIENDAMLFPVYIEGTKRDDLLKIDSSIEPLIKSEGFISSRKWIKLNKEIKTLTSNILQTLESL